MNITDEADLSKAVSESFTTGFLLNLLLTHDDINHAAVLECDSLQTGEYLETVDLPSVRQHSTPAASRVPGRAQPLQEAAGVKVLAGRESGVTGAARQELARPPLVINP